MPITYLLNDNNIIKYQPYPVDNKAEDQSRCVQQNPKSTNRNLKQCSLVQSKSTLYFSNARDFSPLLRICRYMRYMIKAESNDKNKNA